VRLRSETAVAPTGPPQAIGRRERPSRVRREVRVVDHLTPLRRRRGQGVACAGPWRARSRRAGAMRAARHVHKEPRRRSRGQSRQRGPLEGRAEREHDAAPLRK
jgi:hypothetical protein